MKSYFVGILLGFTSIAGAQLPTDFRSEQVFISPEHSEVMQGDTISVRGIVTCLAEKGSEPYSRYVYIELIGEADSALVRSKVRCDEYGRFNVGIPTDPLDPPGIYYLRAFTQFMRNFSHECFAAEPVLVGRKLPHDDGVIDEHTSLYVYPSGGALKPGRPQYITALLLNGQGFPISNCKLSVISNMNDTVTTGITSISGLTHLSFIPESHTHYEVVFREMGVEKRTPLSLDPKITKIEGALSKNRLVFDIDGEITGSRLFAYDCKNGLSEAALTTNKGILTLQETPELATLFLTDSDLNIISETTVGKLPETDAISHPPITSALAPGDSIDITSFNADSLKLISARILEYDNLIAGNAESALTYLADFSSPMPFPARYAGSDERTRFINLNAWLSTARFKRFNLKEVMNASDAAIYGYLPELSMQIKGRVWRGPKQPFKGGTIVAFNEDNSVVYDTVITRDGYFTIDVDDYHDGTEFFLQPINTKEKPEKAEVKIEDYIFPPVTINRRPIQKDRRYLNAEVSIDKSQSLNSRELANVIVKARVKSEPVSSKKFYATRYKDRKEIERRGYLTLRDIIEDMAFIIVRGGRGGPAQILSTRGAASLNDGAPLKVLWDGSEIDSNVLGVLIDQPSQDIESVEQLSVAEALAYVPFGISGAISITTRTGGTRKYNVVSKGTMVTPMGLAHESVEQSTILHAPTTPGKYRLALDYLSNDGKIHSMEFPFEVKNNTQKGVSRSCR